MTIDLENPQSLFDLTGKTALVIGATGSLGGVGAKTLAGAGASVALAGRDLEKLNKNVELIKNAGGNAFGINLRPDSEANAASIVKQACDHMGGLDILFVASGFNKPGTAFETAVADFDKVQDANVRQTWLICREAGRAMVAQGRGGKIIITSSVRGKTAAGNGTAYCTSKAATDMLTKCFAVEYGSSGINVNAIAPAVFRSNLTSWLYAEEGRGAIEREKVLGRIPLGRLGEPEDFAGSILFCASPSSDYMTGNTIMMDGGFTIT